MYQFCIYLFLYSLSQGRLQLFVRTAVDGTGNVIDYFVLDFTLASGDVPVNQTLYGELFGSHVTFTVSLSLRCTADFYGPDCSIHCRPASQIGHYTCLRKEGLPCYHNQSTNCSICGQPSDLELCTNKEPSSMANNCTTFPKPGKWMLNGL